MPVASSAGDLARAIDRALPDGAQLVGFTSEAVGIAVRRALKAATSWHDHTFDVIGPRIMAPTMHVALDEVLPGEVAAGRRNPLLRLWDWDAPLVVIGSFQSVRNEVDTDALARHGMSVVRRIPGGGAMFMQPGNCITYSLVVPPPSSTASASNSPTPSSTTGCSEPSTTSGSTPTTCRSTTSRPSTARSGERPRSVSPVALSCIMR